MIYFQKKQIEIDEQPIVHILIINTDLLLQVEIFINLEMLVIYYHEINSIHI